MFKIGIIGKGFVGSAVQFGFSPNVGCDAEVRIYDKDPNKSTHSLEETINKSDFIFISVPTPANSDGSMNLDIVNNVFSDISKVNKRKNNIMLLRSTVVPGSTRSVQEKFKNLNIVFNPEFLTERSAKFDFINQSRIILGGKNSHTLKVSKLFKQRFGETIPVIRTNFETAEIIKYMTNTFLAVKVSFLNDMKRISDNSNVDWGMAVEGFVRDGRIGHTHLAVPGPDGKMGFGGSCFPKDIQAMINYADSLGINANVIKGAWETNLKVRPEEDWKELKGRAVIDKDINKL
jgi:UDPglucose 6-dehydrogenase